MRNLGVAVGVLIVPAQPIRFLETTVCLFIFDELLNADRRVDAIQPGLKPAPT